MTFERSGLEKYDFSMGIVKSNPKTWILQKNQLRARVAHFSQNHRKCNETLPFLL